MNSLSFEIFVVGLFILLKQHFFVINFSKIYTLDDASWVISYLKDNVFISDLVDKR